MTMQNVFAVGLVFIPLISVLSSGETNTLGKRSRYVNEIFYREG